MELGKARTGNQILIRHDYKRACYRALLSDFTIDEVKEFFNSVPLVIEGRSFRGTELYEHLWQEKKKIPAWWDMATDNRLEAFIIAKGRTVKHVMDKMLWLNNKSTVMPGKVLLTWFYPKLEAYFNSVDTRDMVFPLLTIHNENWLPGVVHKRIKKTEEGDWINSIMMFRWEIDCKEFLDWDFELIAAPQILAAPVMLGLPPFEGFGMISDCRPPERILWESECTTTPDGLTFLIGGRLHGRMQLFGDFCREKGLELGKYAMPDFLTYVMDQDYYCEKRNRVVLHKGCAYAAPLFLHLVGHRKLSLQKKDVFTNFVADLAREEELQDDGLEVKHKALLASIIEKTIVEYHACDESISINGSYFTKGVSAKILKYLVEAFTKHHRVEFEYREIKRQFEITLGQKNSNFEVRFYRVVDKLECESLPLRIKKTGRGKFQLLVNGVFEYRESAARTLAP